MSSNFGLQIGDHSMKFVFHFERQKLLKSVVTSKRKTKTVGVLSGLVSGTVSTTRKHRPMAQIKHSARSQPLRPYYKM